MPVEHCIRGSDNAIKLTLTEDGVPISGAWAALNIYIANVFIGRQVDGNGITLSTTTGLLTIVPGDLLAAEQVALRGLQAEVPHDVRIVVHSALNDDGAVFGGLGSEPIRFILSDKPV